MIYTMDWFFNETFSDIIKILLSIDSIIYWLIAQFFRFVIDVSSSEFVMSDIINAIIGRFYIIVGVFALFMMSYSLIKGLFDPDGMFKGKNSLGSIVKNLLIAIALVALMPTIFQYMFRFQSIIINNNVIGNIVLGANSDAMKFKVDGKDVPVTVENVGYENYIKIASNNVAFSALNAFVYADDDDKDIDLSQKITAGTFLTPRIGYINSSIEFIKSIYKDTTGENTTTFNQLRNNVVITGNFLEVNTIAYHVATGGDFHNDSGAHITYLFVVSTLCGIILLGLIFVFSISVVIRMFNLFLLELISPIASFSLVIPNSKIFNNWLTTTLKEYFDIFIRLFTFNLAILFFANIHSIMSQLISTSSTFGILNILFIIGLLLFINQAPKLVKDIFGIKEDKKNILSKTLGGALGLAGGLAAGGMGVAHALGKGGGDTKGIHRAWNAIKGGASGFAAGKDASKAKSFSDFTGAIGKRVAATDTNRKKGDLYYKQHGSNLGGVIKGRAIDAFNYAAGTDPFMSYKEYQDQEAKMDDIKKQINSINDMADKNAVVSSKKDDWQSHKDSLLTKDKFLHNERARVEQLRDTATNAAVRDAHSAYLTKLLNDSKVQDTAYRNYLVGYQNELQKLDTEYKTERSNFINSQASNHGTEIGMAFDKIKNDLIKQKELGNKYLEGVDIEGLEVSSGTFKDEFLSNVKDRVFGKDQLYNDKAVSVDIGDASLAGIINSDELNATLGTKFKKVKVGSSYQTIDITNEVRADNIVELLASTQAGYATMSDSQKKSVRESVRASVGAAVDSLVQNTVDYYESYVNGDSARNSTAVSNIDAILAANSYDTTVSYEDLVNALAKSNSGTSRAFTGGTIHSVHASTNYQRAHEEALKAYEKEKENK